MAEELFHRQQAMGWKMMERSRINISKLSQKPEVELPPLEPPDRHSFLEGEYLEENHRHNAHLSSIDTTSSASHFEDDSISSDRRHIYEKYNWKFSTMPTLPIHAYKETVLTTLTKTNVMIVSGSTGSGKSTCVPQFILDDAMTKNQSCNILITQPKRIAARTLAKYVAQSRGWQLGTVVGYQVGLDRKIGSDTLVQYVTTGILLERLVSNPTHISRYSHIIIDECHERDTDMDLVFYFLRQALINKITIKVILMSATITVDKLSAYFRVMPTDPCVLHVDQRMYEVKEYFLEGMVRLGLLSNAEKKSVESNLSDDAEMNCSDNENLDSNSGTIPQLSTHKKELLYRILCHIQLMEMDEQHVTSYGMTKCGTVLVFLPGLWDIFDVMGFLRSYRPPSTDPRYSSAHVGGSNAERHGQPSIVQSWKLIPLHSQINSDDQDLIFCSPQLGKRKIILATNIAESSITIPDVKYVIDFGMTKQLQYHPDTTFTALRTVWTSQSSSKQRRGRAGRVQAGEYYCLISQNAYDSLLTEDLPETLRVPLEHVVLKIKKARLDPLATLENMIDPPERSRIGQSILNLAQLGAISIVRDLTVTMPAVNQSTGSRKNYFHRKLQQSENGGVNCMDMSSLRRGGSLTLIGELMCALPLDVHASKLIAMGYCLSVIEECIIIACGMCVNHSIFIPIASAMSQSDRPRGMIHMRGTNSKPIHYEYLTAYENRLRFSGRAHSDGIAILNAYVSWQQSKCAGRFKSLDGELDWCRRRYLDLRTLREVDSRVIEVRKRVEEEFGINLRNPNDIYNLFSDNKPSVTTASGDSLSQDYRLFLITLAICGAFYPNYFLRDYATTLESDGLRELLDHDPRRAVSVRGVPQGQGAAYINTLKEWFSQCLPEAEKNQVQVMPYESQAIVVFPPERNHALDLPRGATLPVYLAMQLGCPSIPRMKASLPTDVTEKMDLVSSLAAKSAQRYHLDIPVEYLSNHIGFPAEEVNSVDIHLLQMEDVGLMYGIYSEQVHSWNDLTSQIRDIEASLPQLKVSEITPGLLCVASQQRVRIIAYNSRSLMAQVLYVDRGDIKECRLDELRLLNVPEIQRIPEMGVRIALAHIRPTTLGHANDIWNDDDRSKFSEFVHSHLFEPWHCEIYSVVGRELRVDMFSAECHPPYEEEFSLNRKLIKEKMAELSGESVVSEEDHRQRRKAWMTGRQPEKKYVNPFGHKDFPSFTSLNNAIEDISRLMKDRSLSQHGTTPLRGPVHPYCMKFSGLCRSMSGKAPSIAKDSVNSVIIDDHPENHTARLLVAGIVQQHPRDDTKLVLRHTTLMPHINGLPMLAALLFTPFAELRVDTIFGARGSDRTCYKGVCCGLGYNKELQGQNEEYTMEIYADVLVTNSDLDLVNNIRCGFSMLLMDKICDATRAVTCFNVIRENIFKLFEVRRRFINISPSHEYFAWRQIKNEHYVKPAMNLSSVQLSFSPHFAVNGVTKKMWKMLKPGITSTNEESIELHQRIIQRVKRNNEELNSIASRSTISSRQNDTLSLVAVCEICEAVIKNRLHVIAHLEDQSHKELYEKLVCS